MKAARGFSLIEAVVGMTMTLVVASFAAAALVVVFHTQREGQLRNAVTRQASFLVDTVARDLEYTGVGVPRGALAGETAHWRPALRTGTPSAFVIVGDAPYPTSLESGVVHIAGSDAGGGALLIASERTGCVPGTGCLGRGLTTSGCTAGDIACAWSPDKWRPPPAGGSVDIVITFPDGRWVPRSVPLTAAGAPERPVTIATASGNRVGVGIDGGPIPVPLLTVAPGPTIAATLDRIYYTLEDATGGPCPFTGAPDAAPDTPQCSLYRRQCWGYADPLVSLAAGAQSRRTGDAPVACDVPNQGTRWELVSNAVNQMRFRYYAADGSEIVPAGGLVAAELAQVASIEVEATVIRALADVVIQVQQTMIRRVALTAGGGSVSSSVASGGCADVRSAACLHESFQGAR